MEWTSSDILKLLLCWLLMLLVTGIVNAVRDSRDDDNYDDDDNDDDGDWEAVNQNVFFKKFSINNRTEVLSGHAIP